MCIAVAKRCGPVSRYGMIENYQVGLYQSSSNWRRSSADAFQARRPLPHVCVHRCQWRKWWFIQDSFSV